jgi:GAF domain-containing protein
MGFAAIARVTEEHWIACSVRDEISFGLEPGGELEIATTICNEIRNHKQPVVIDHVDVDESFNCHPTPRMYGFQSYISMPIILRNGEFFGTLCAIDPKPAQLKNVRVTGMFKLFAELIAFHIQSIQLMDISETMLKETGTKLTEVLEQNRKYEHLTYHSLREPLRKISLYSDFLVHESNRGDIDNIKKTAGKIVHFSGELANMIRQLKD